MGDGKAGTDGDIEKERERERERGGEIDRDGLERVR